MASTSRHGAKIISPFDNPLSDSLFALICANMPHHRKVVTVTAIAPGTNITNIAKITIFAL